MLTCCVRSCKFPDTRTKISIFRIPKELDRCYAWIMACNRSDLLQKTPEELYKNYRVCGKHFELKCFTSPERNRLLPSAVPTVFQPPYPCDEDPLRIPEPSNILRTLLLEGAQASEKPEKFRPLILKRSIKGRTKSLVLGKNDSIGNKENSVISGDSTKFVAEPGRIPTIYLTPLEKLQQNESDAPSTSPRNQHGSTNGRENYTTRTSSADGVKNWEVEDNTYTVVLCEVKDETKQEEENQDAEIQKVCRTCLKVFDIEDTVVIYDEVENPLENGISLKEKLYNLLPYIDFNLSEKPVVVCKKCENSINVSYDFKLQCKSSEMRLRHASRLAKRPLTNLLKVIDDLPPVNEVDENILDKPYIDSAPAEESETLDEATEESTTKSTIKDPSPIEETGFVKDEITLSDLEEGWEWDTIRCDSFEESKPKKRKTSYLQDHDYIPACENELKFDLQKFINPRVKFDIWDGDLDVLSPQFGEYLKYRKGKPGGKIIKRINNLKKPMNGRGPFLCEYCGYVSLSVDRYRRHIEIKHEMGERKACPECGKMVIVTLFRQHLKIRHSTEQKNTIHICHKCGKCFSNRPALAIHIKTHENRVKKFQCPICSKSYYTNYALRTHKLCHGEKQFKCEYCFMSFHHEFRLRKHLQKHEVEAAFQCNICDKVLKYQRSLEEHMKAHANDNKFKCDFCDESFRKKASLELHKNKVHLKKDFKCEYCLRQFYLKYNLDRHLENQHGKSLHTNFRCNKCDKGYVREEPYKQHLIERHGIYVEQVEEHMKILLSDAEEELIEYVEVDSEDEGQIIEEDEENCQIMEEDEENCQIIEEGEGSQSMEEGEGSQSMEEEDYQSVEEQGQDGQNLEDQDEEQEVPEETTLEDTLLYEEDETDSSEFYDKRVEVIHIPNEI